MTDLSKWKADAELVASRIVVDYGAFMRWVVKYPKLAVALSSVAGFMIGFLIGRL